MNRLDVLPRPLTQMVGPTSIVRAVRTILNSPGEPRLHSVSSVPNSFSLIGGADMSGHTGAMAETWEGAAASAIGECVERYCCAVQPPQLLVASAAELGAEAIPLDGFELFAERQYAHENFPFPRQDDSLPITWAEAHRLRDQARRLVPACLVYIPYIPRLPDSTDMLALSVSSGQACHTDRDIALLSGLYEVIERDAFMLTWVRRLTPNRLDLSTDPELSAWFDRYFSGTSLSFDVLRLPHDTGLPTVLCVARGTSEAGPFGCVGAATRLDEPDAIRKAVIEAAQGAVWVRDLIRTLPDWRPEPHFVNVRDFPDHVRLYGLPEMLGELDFLTAGPTVPVAAGVPRSPQETLETCLTRIEAVGLEPLVCDIGTRDVREAGIHVVRVLIPGSVQLYAVHGLPTFGARRLDTVPRQLGFDAEVHRSFNPAPHPFP
jgi:ribosomal protein S12 methylthiotransferase accessory factor